MEQGEIQNIFDIVFQRVGSTRGGTQSWGASRRGPDTEEINQFFRSLQSFRKFTYSSNLNRYKKPSPSTQILSVLKRLQFHAASTGTRVFAVTSLEPNTSTVALSTMLAKNYASQETGKVLLIDAGDPRSGLSRQLGIVVHVSIFDLFSGTALSDVVVTSDEMFGVVPTRAAEDAPGEWFAHPKTDLILSEITRYFDLVIVDTPPLSTSVDSILIGKKGGGVVLNVKANTISREGLQMVNRRFKELEVPLAGVVLWDERRYLPRWVDHLFGTRDLISA